MLLRPFSPLNVNIDLFFVLHHHRETQCVMMKGEDDREGEP